MSVVIDLPVQTRPVVDLADLTAEFLGLLAARGVRVDQTANSDMSAIRTGLTMAAGYAGALVDNGAALFDARSPIGGVA